MKAIVPLSCWDSAVAQRLLLNKSTVIHAEDERVGLMTNVKLGALDWRNNSFHKRSPFSRALI